MRRTVIISGAIAAVALVTLTANAGNGATHRVQGSLVSLVAATTAVSKADREAITVGARSTTQEQSPEPAEKPVVAVKPAAPRVFQKTAACQQAINALKALHEADVTEDAAERARQQPVSASALAADRAEDAAEALQWTNALTAARNACLPQRSAACRAAIDSLQALVQANRLREWSQLAATFRDRSAWQTQLASLKAAFAAVASSCAQFHQ